jgi:hypothetical protein
MRSGSGNSVLQGILGKPLAMVGGLVVDPYVNIKLAGELYT